MVRYNSRVLRYFLRVLALPVPAQLGQRAALARVLRYNPRVLRYFLRVLATLALPVRAQRAAPARVVRYNSRVLRYFLRVVRAHRCANRRVRRYCACR